ncbi:PilC/PilY family type IV pilus protein [Archangium sp.]|uniref:PilC/PilY family type IV pilus protein n=1 Tax=Archangium sp. TaxID=1872627 RepID=UPI00286A4161|nr:PilC/PilY family type IV pilus protein [Archangium sp.]
MIALRIRALSVLCLLALPMAARATDVRFEQGSLIIPMQKAYQTQCGATAAYGLVYRLLQQGVTVYWAVQPNKSSHHRCKTLVDSSSATAIYLDGCDMEVAKESGRPVSLLKNESGTFTNDFSTFDTSSNPNGTGEVSFKVDLKQKRVRYMGGPFLIDATDASKAIDLMKTHPDFAAFRGAAGDVNCAPGTKFNVRVHRINNAVVAPIARIMNEVPPPIALVKGRNTTSAGSVEILRQYLRNAGLDFKDAEGTFDKHGKIFDVLDQDVDLVSTTDHPRGKLNYAPDPSTPNKTYYKVMWSPHWEGDTSKQDQLKSGLANIAHFVDLGNSIFNECASIETYEDSYKPDDGKRDHYADNEPTQFMSKTDPSKPGAGLTTLTTKELIGDSGFAPNGQDCSDPGVKGDCYVFHNYGDLFSQKGDYEFSLTFGAVEGFRPRKGQAYGAGTLRMISTKSGTASKDGWDIYISRPKDNNRQKGNVLYLSGHSFASATAGSRIVLNTLLNLAYKPQALETSRSEPVADVTYKPDGSVDQVRVLSGTYLYTPPQALFPERINFASDKDSVMSAKAADWVFPYIEGRFRSLVADSIDTNRQGFSKNAEWEATERIPAPGSRNLFTVLGSNQEGLKRVNFGLTQLIPGCVDDDTSGKIKNVCDLQEALSLDRDSSGKSWVDLDANGVVDPTLAKAKLEELNHASQHFVQRVRGFCVAHDVTDSNKVDTLTPTVSDCDNRQFGEVRSTLGGLDHASAAVVGPSDYIKSPRPEMIYIGGLDGQLHALYLRGTQDGFEPPKPGTELWAFIPKGQLSRLRTNNARVDVSPVVSDVYVDYEDKNADGVLSPDERNTGLYRWRTVLISGSGRLGGEIFALDVTDPLKPLVLWDVLAGVDNTDDPVVARNTAFLWSDRAEGPVPNYKELSSAKRTGPYNYTDLGDSLDMNLVPVRRGNRPSFQVILSTNGARSGAQQLQVFALDAGTGRKLWQWERPYGADTSNSVPGGTSTLDVDGDGAMDRVYVGDMEGRLWELSIHTGINLNSFDGSPKAGSYPLFATQDAQHPISTVPAIMRLPYALSEGPFSKLTVGAAAGGKLALVFGTAGPDWVLARNGSIKGRVYVVASTPEDLRIRDQLSYDKTNPVPYVLGGQMLQRGTTRPGAGMYVELAEKERAVGSPKLVGSKIVLTSAYGTTETDPFSSDMQGRTHVLDLSKTAANKVVSESGKAAAGGLVLPDGTIITQSMVGLQRAPAASLGGEVPKTGLSGKRTQARIGSWLDLGRALAE